MSTHMNISTPQIGMFTSCIRAHVESYDRTEADIRFAMAMELSEDDMICLLHFIATKSPSLNARKVADVLIQMDQRLKPR